MSSRYLNPLQGWRFPPSPLVICPGAAHLPIWTFFPSIQPEPPKPQFVTFASCYTLCHHQEEFGSVIFSAALQEAGGYYYIVLLPPGHASTLLLAPMMGHSSQKRSPTTSCWMLVSTWHLSAGAASICKQAM